MRLDRTNNSVFGRWWWTVDRLTLMALFMLMCLGAVLVAAASPPVATRLNLPAFYFVHRHQTFLAVGFLAMLVISFFSPVTVRRVATIGFLISVILMVAVLFVGVETKGAHRWITLGAVSLQPSEFMKPCFAVVMAWICTEKNRRAGFPGNRLAVGLYILVATLLLLQPDFGMTITVTLMWAIQFFMAGLPFLWVAIILVFGILGSISAYHFFPHVQRRIDSFLDPTAGDNYQVAKSLEAFAQGGVLGRGPGEGQVKRFLPDSHTDFVFSVAGEEFGMLACVLIVFLFGLIVLRSLRRVGGESDLFTLLAVTGLVAQFGIQAIINMGVAVNLLPAKGMTLPFLSYGGSSVIAIAIGMGMVLALTRRRFGDKRSK